MSGVHPRPQPPIRVGVVGAGKIAQIAELPALVSRDDVVLAGLVTATAASARSNLSRWPFERSYASFEEMIDLANLDVVCVLTPKHLHTSFVIQAIDAGLDVFCEKPLATTIDDATRCVEAAERSGSLLMVAFNRRYAPVYVEAKAYLDGRTPAFCMAQKNRNDREYRATLENAIHMVDLLRWFCGEPTEVRALARGDDEYFEDGTVATIAFESGAIGIFAGIRTAGEWEERLDVHLDNETVRVDAPDSYEVIGRGEARRVEMRPRLSGWARVGYTLGFEQEIDHFVECVRERRTPLTSGAEALRTQVLVEEILRDAGLPTTDRDRVAEGPSPHA